MWFVVVAVIFFVLGAIVGNQITVFHLSMLLEREWRNEQKSGD